MKPQNKNTLIFLTLLILLIVSLACQAITGLRGSGEKFVPVCTPPACKAGEEYYCAGDCPGGCGTTCKTSGGVYDGCAFMINLPGGFTTEDMGWDAVFTPASTQAGWISIHATKISGESLEFLLAEAASRYSPQTLDTSSITPVIVRDYMDQPLPGLQVDFSNGNDHIRLLVVLRPETLLGDLVAQDVVYELTACAPSESWGDLEPASEVIFKSFTPSDCGGE